MGAQTRSPEFIGSLENVTISQGRDATFTCTVTHLGGHRVAWIKSDSKAILAIHNHVITNNDRLQVTHNDKDTWTLHIKDVKTKDAGQYMCQVNSVPMVSQVANLQVVVAPEISDKMSTRDVSVSELGTARFFCQASGNPLPSVEWTRVRNSCTSGKHCDKIRIKTKSGRIRHDSTYRGSELVMPSVTRADMGAYMCIARNGVPPATSKIFKLIVNFKPQIEVGNQVVGAPVGTSVILACKIQASPKPITFWRKRTGGEMLVPGTKYNITERSINGYTIVNTLQMRSIDVEDYGEYSCVSKNTIGQSEESIEMHQIERSEADSSVTSSIPQHTRHSNDLANKNTYLFFEELSTKKPTSPSAGDSGEIDWNSNVRNPYKKNPVNNKTFKNSTRHQNGRIDFGIWPTTGGGSGLSETTNYFVLPSTAAILLLHLCYYNLPRIR